LTDKRASELISRNLTAIYGYAFARLYDKDQADELASEIVYEIITSARNLKNEEAFWGFAWKVAENTFRRFIRRKQLAAQTVEFTDSNVGVYVPSPEEEYVCRESESEEIYLLRRELSLLKKTHREVSVAYYVENKSCSQIAQEQNLSVEMVKYHLFKTRKLLKEGIGMTRTLGEKSYNPGTFRLDFWGDYNGYAGLFRRKLPGAIVLAAYYEPMTAEALSMELGVSMPYLEEEIETLEAAGLLKKTGEKYQTNIVIITDAYEKEFIRNTAAAYKTLAGEVFDKVKVLLPQIRTLSFYGSSYSDNRLLFGVLSIAFVRGYEEAEKQNPLGRPEKLPLGGHGWIFGYDNDYTHHHYDAVTLDNRNAAGTAWFSAVNYRATRRAQVFEHSDFENKGNAICDAILGNEADRANPSLPWLIEHGYIISKGGRLSANFPVFDAATYEMLCQILAEVTGEVAECMNSISARAETLLAEHAPAALKEKCRDIARIHHRFDVGAFLLEALINENRLTVPDRNEPLSIWGVRC